MIIGAICTSFKVEVLTGVHIFGTDTIKLALYSSSASLGPTTTAYTTTGEVTGTNYSAGGSTLTAIAPTSSGTTAILDFNDLTFSNVTLTARGAMIYNSSKANRAIAILDFGSDRVKAAADFIIRMPVANATDAVIRID